jgi:hypothetical protein
MAAEDAKGFWSYVHADDDAEFGRIRQLADLLRKEFGLQTGEELQLFLDRDSIEWGDDWRERLERALADITFFIPVVTPRYFKSAECRRELLEFSELARLQGVEDLVLPILYMDVAGLESDSPDQAIAAVARHQWEDWRLVRLEDPASPEHRKAVSGLAERLVAISASVTVRPVRSGATREALATVGTAAQEATAKIVNDDGTAELEEPGLLDVLADAEAHMPRWGETITALGPAMEKMADAVNASVAQIERADAQGKGFAGRLDAVRRLARALDEPATEIESLGAQYAADLIRVDQGILALIDLAGQEGLGEEERREACGFFKSLTELGESSREQAEALTGLSTSIDEAAGFSRELRPPMRKIADGLRGILDAQAVIDEWVRRIERSPLNCAENLGAVAAGP